MPIIKRKIGFIRENEFSLSCLIRRIYFHDEILFFLYLACKKEMRKLKQQHLSVQFEFVCDAKRCRIIGEYMRVSQKEKKWE
jgi:hypothetical protein